jgi:hypothetical protein
LVALASAYRYDGHEVNERLAKSEADILHDAIKNKAFNREEVTRILGTRSKTQLRAIFNSYKDVHHTPITTVHLLFFPFKFSTIYSFYDTNYIMKILTYFDLILQ